MLVILNVTIQCNEKYNAMYLNWMLWKIEWTFSSQIEEKPNMLFPDFYVNQQNELMNRKPF